MYLCIKNHYKSLSIILTSSCRYCFYYTRSQCTVGITGLRCLSVCLPPSLSLSHSLSLSLSLSPSQIMLFCGDKKFEVFANGRHVCDYNHRLTPFTKIDHLAVLGDLQMSFLIFWHPTLMSLLGCPALMSLFWCHCSDVTALMSLLWCHCSDDLFWCHRSEVFEAPSDPSF